MSEHPFSLRYPPPSDPTLLQTAAGGLLTRPAPPPPPLPPTRYVNRATTALARFVAQPFTGGAARPASGNESRAGQKSSRLATSQAPPRSASRITSQTATHRTGISIAALDISPEKTHAVLAGKEILKTIRVSGTNCAEEFNLRAAIIAYSSTHNATAGAVAAKHKDDLAATDVKWSHGNYDSTIATACPTGRIMLYDLNRAGVEIARLDEHHRQVHKLAFNPNHGHLMLSASQDTTIRLWDLRATQDGRSVLSFQSLHQYKGNSEGLRDVKWSPTEGTAFACATDAGAVQRWDLRKDRAPIQKINAHKRICMSIDWHPDGKHLASAGLDKQVQIWDLSTTSRRSNSSWSFRAPQAVTKVRWRPVGWRSGPEKGPGRWETTQLVTSYNMQDPRVHVWDLQSPFVPFREIDRSNHAPTDMLWHSEGLLWTVSVEGMFTQTDIHFAPKVEDRVSWQAFDISSDGELSFFTRARQGRVSPTGSEERRPAISIRGKHQGKGSRNGEKLGGSRSSTENETTGFFSSSTQSKQNQKSSARAAKSLIAIPSKAYANIIATHLNEILVSRAKANHGQFAAYGRILGSFNPEVFAYLVKNAHLAKADREICQVGHIEWLATAMERNAKCAGVVGMYRLAQTWRVVGHVALTDVWSQANERRATRLVEEVQRRKTAESNKTSSIETVKRSKMKVPPTTKSIPRSNSRDLHHSIIESTSNLTTPLAKPLPDSPMSIRHESPVASLRGDDFILPPPRYRREPGNGPTPRKDSFPSSGRRDLFNSSPSRIDFHSGELEQRRQANAQRRPTLRLDSPSKQVIPTTQTPRGARRTSSESLTMFSSSSGGKSSFPGGSSMGSEQAMTTGDRQDIRLRSPIREDEDHGRPLERQITNSSNVTESTSHDTIAFSDDYFAQNEGMEASGTIIADDDPLPNHVRLLSPPSASRPHRSSPQPGQLASSPSITSHTNPNLSHPPPEDSFVPSDFSLSSPTRTAYQASTSWTSLTTLISKSIVYQLTRSSDHLTPTILLLLLTPHLSADSPPPLSPSRQLALLHTLHHQLTSLSLHTAAAQLRRLTHTSHPSLAAPYLDRSTLAFRCTTCGGRCSTLTNARRSKTSFECDKCGRAQAGCPICSQRDRRQLWVWCQGCGHGGHTACLAQWWADESAEGACAVLGCLHDCVDGPRRRLRLSTSSSSTTTTTLSQPPSVAPVKPDDWVTQESRAVNRLLRKSTAPDLRTEDRAT